MRTKLFSTGRQICQQIWREIPARVLLSSALTTTLTLSLSLSMTLGCGDGAFGSDGSGSGVVDPPVIPLPDAPDLSARPERPQSPFAPADARLRRLLQPQYENAVRDLLGTAAAEAAAPPADVPLNGFVSVGAGDLSVSASAVESYEASAAAVAAAAVADPTSPLHAICTPVSVDDVGCWSQIVQRLGRRAYRRTLAADEIQRIVDVAVQAASAYGEVGKGKEFLALALLQSPHFLYLVEIGEPADPASARRLTGVELASRLSFFLTGAPPSDALLDAAEQGALSSSPTSLEAEARALLTDPRAKQALRDYFAEKLQMALLPTLSRPTPPAGTDGVTPPELSQSMRQLMVEETLRTIDDVVWTRNVDARELLTTKDTFVNDELAGYYGFDLPGSGTFFQRVRPPEEQERAGIFSQGAFLVRFAHPDRSSPTLRGKFLREQLLCSPVPAPPNDVITTLPPGSDDNLPQTTRDRLQAHATIPRCAACHEAMDPLGYAFEHFDQYGRYRTHENGLPIDASAELDGEVADGAAGFLDVLDGRSDMVSCLVRGLFRHATGHLEEAGEDASLYDVDTAFIGSGLRLQEALVGIATADAFLFVNTFDEAPAAGGGDQP